MDLSSYSQEIQKYIEEDERKWMLGASVKYDTCQRILAYAAETNSDALFGLGYYRFAEYYWEREDAEQTMHCLEESVKCFLNAGIYEYLGRVYNMMGIASANGGGRLVALSYFYTGILYCEQCGDIYTNAMANCNIAYILLCMKHYKEAKERYRTAIAYFERTKDRVFGCQHLLQGMIQCGFCYLLLEEYREALGIRKRIRQLLQENPECACQEISRKTFEAACEYICGHKEYAEQLLDRLTQEIYLEENVRELKEMIVLIADFLYQNQRDRYLELLLRTAEETGIVKNIDIRLDMYPFKSQFLLKHHRVHEYVEYTKEYLELYQQSIRDSHAVMARIMELQERLRTIEMEQREILADNQKLKEIALYDSMTNLPNRTYLNEYLSKQFEEASEKHTPFGVELMDIDFFKEYNDTYGHLAGDGCIEKVSNVLHGVEAPNVFCARYGGDEFMVVYSGLEAEEIETVARNIQEGVRGLNIPHAGSTCSGKVTVSQGIFVKVPEEENREWDFNSMADNALYQAKREGRNCYRIVTKANPGEEDKIEK